MILRSEEPVTPMTSVENFLIFIIPLEIMTEDAIVARAIESPRIMIWEFLRKFCFSSMVGSFQVNGSNERGFEFGFSGSFRENQRNGGQYFRLASPGTL